MEPRPESRISSLEHRVSTVEAQIIEQSADTAEELKAIRQDGKALFEHMQQGFEQANALIKETASKEDVRRLEARIGGVEQQMDSMDSKLDQILKLMQKQERGES